MKYFFWKRKPDGQDDCRVDCKTFVQLAREIVQATGNGEQIYLIGRIKGKTITDWACVYRDGTVESNGEERSEQ